MNHRYNSLLFFNLEFKFLLMHQSNFYVTWFLYGFNTRDAVERLSRSQADFDVAATVTSSWILAATATVSWWILAATASSRACRPEFQHFFPTFGPGILAAAVGTSSWRANPVVRNASMDNTNTVTTFFFTTDGKTYLCLSILTFVI
jgi:hypothetical protein